MPIKENEVSFTYDLEDLLNEVPEDDREDAAAEAGELALQKVHEYMDRQISPVKGESNFKALKKDSAYRKLKQRRAGNQRPNLRLTGDLIESMEVDADESSFTISVEGKKNIGKAHNHNTRKTKRSPLPKRQFLPDDSKRGQTFKRSIVKAIKETIAKYKRPKPKKPPVEAPPETVTVNFDKLLSTFKATRREKQIAKDVKTFRIEDIL